MQQFKRQDDSKFLNKFVRAMLLVNEQFYCYRSIKTFLFIVSMSQNIFYLYFPSYEKFQENVNQISTNMKILYLIRPETILIKNLPEDMLYSTPFIIILLILIIKFIVYLNIDNQHLRFAKKWKESTPLQILLINITSYYQQLFNAVLHQPLQTIIICTICRALKQIFNFNSSFIALLIFVIFIFLLLEMESVFLIFICRQSTTLQILAFEKFPISTLDFLIYAFQLIQIVVYGIASSNIIVEYFQIILTLIIAALNIANQLHHQGFILQYQRYLLYIINSIIVMYSLFKMIDLVNNGILIWPLFTSIVIYADNQQQVNSIYSLFLERIQTLPLQVQQLIKISNNCYQTEIIPIYNIFMWNHHQGKCKDTNCICKQNIQFVLDPKQTNIITEPIFKSFIYNKINHIKKLIYNDNYKYKIDSTFYEIVQATLFMRQGFILMAIKNFNKILIQCNDQHRERIISQEQPLTSQTSRRRLKSQIDSQIKEIIYNQQQKDNKFKKINKSFSISNLELIKVQYRINQSQMYLNENFSSHICSPQQHKMSDFIFEYLINEFDLNELISKFTNLVKMKNEFYYYLLKSENLNGNHIFKLIMKISQNIKNQEKILLRKYQAYSSVKLRHIIQFFYQQIYNSYLKALNFKKKNNVQQQKFILRNQTIDFYSDKIGYILLQLQDDLQSLKIQSYSSNFMTIIDKTKDENKLHFSQILPEFIKDAHPILVQRFIQTGQARFYRSLSLTFIQQDNGLVKQMEQSFDTITLIQDDKIIFGAVIQDVIDQKAYFLVNVNGFLSGMTFTCLKRLGFTNEEIQSVNNFYSFYEVEINQIIPNFTHLIEKDFSEQKFDNIRFLFLDITCNFKDTMLKSSQFQQIWYDDKLVNEYQVNLFIMKRNIFGFFYYIIEIESAYKINHSYQNRNTDTIKNKKNTSESALFDVESLILPIEDSLPEGKAQISKQEHKSFANQVTKQLEFQRNFQGESFSPKNDIRSNLIEKSPQIIDSVQRNYKSQQQDFFCQKPLVCLAEYSNQDIKSQNQNLVKDQFEVVFDINSETSINSIKKPQFIQKLETIERFYSNANFQQQKILLFTLILILIVCCIFSIFILSLLNKDLKSKIQDLEMLSFQANIVAPYDRYLGVRAQIYYYQGLYTSNKISFQEQKALVEPLYSIVGICYNELKTNSYQSLLENDLNEFFKDLYTNTFFMGTTDKIIYQRNITFREFIHQLLNYQYDFKIIFDKRIPTKGCPCQVFQFSNYFNLQENLEQLSQEILNYTIEKCKQIINKWINIWIAFVIVCFFLGILIYYIKRLLSIQFDTIMEIVTHLQEQSLQREINFHKSLLLNIEQNITFSNDLDYQLEKQVSNKIQNQTNRKQKRKRFVRISKINSILFSSIFLGFYLLYSCFVILSSQNFLNKYEYTSDFYKLIADLSFRSGNMFLYREMFMLWGNLTYLNKSDGLKLYNLIDIAQNRILDFIDLAPRINQENLLISQDFLNLFQEVQNNNVCDYLDEYYSQILGQFCLKTFDGSLIKGILAGLTFIRQTIINQQATNNFTYRTEDIYYEVEGGQIVSRVFSYMNEQLQKGIIAKTESFNLQNQLLSIFFLIVLISICFYILFFYYKKIKLNLKMMKFSVYLIPQQDIIENDVFEKYIRQIEIKLGQKL